MSTATTKKVFGLQETLGKELEARLRRVLTAHDALDTKEASSERQLKVFSMLMLWGILVAGAGLMAWPLQPGETDISTEWGVSMPTTCLRMNQTLLMMMSSASTSTTMRISIATLFSFISGAAAVEPICISLILCLRKFEVGGASVVKVRAFLRAHADPWPSHAAELKHKREVAKAASRGYARMADERVGLKGQVANAFVHNSGRCTVLKRSVANTAKGRSFGMILSDDPQPVIVSVSPSGLAAVCGLLAGDRILSINGVRLTAGRVQIERMRPIGRFDFIVSRRDWGREQRQQDDQEARSPASGARRAKHSKGRRRKQEQQAALAMQQQQQQQHAAAANDWDDSRLVSANKSPGQRVGLSLQWNGGERVACVSAVLTSSPFAGFVRPGDEVLEVNGYPVSVVPGSRANAPTDGAAVVAYARQLMLDAGGTIVLRVRTPGLLRLASDAVSNANASSPRGRARAALHHSSDTRVHQASSPMEGAAEGAAEGAVDGGTESEAIRVSNASFNYGELSVLSDCDLTVPVGARCVVFGRSGCGKSTLLKLIARLYPPLEGGSVEIFGQPVNDVVLADVLSFMEQSQVLFEGSVGHNLRLGLGKDAESDLASLGSLRDACVQVAAWADLESLSGARDEEPLDFDVGYRGKRVNDALGQRLCLARCLLRRKPLLILDEPMSSQDPGAVKELTEMLGTLRAEHEGKDVPVTCLISSHQTEIARACSHAAFLMNGRVVEMGKTEELMARKGHFYRRMMAASGLSIDAKGVASVEGERLRQVWLFANAPWVSLADLAHSFRTRTCRCGDTIFEAGEEASTMHIVVSGLVEDVIERPEQPENDGAQDAEKAANPGGRINAGRIKRAVHQAGDCFGVSALIDDSSVWTSTAKVSSSRAVLLELSRHDLEAKLATDPQLKESVGELRNELAYMRSPKRLAQLWPFFGLPHHILEALSMTIEPMTLDAEALLCDAPRDPCAALSMIVLGQVELLSCGPSGEAPAVEKLGRGGVIGEIECLPSREQGSAEEMILSRQGSVVRARATSFTLVLSLPRVQLDDLSKQHPEVHATIDANVAAWVAAVRPASIVAKDWMLSSCPPEALAALATLWQPSVEVEGTLLLDQKLLVDRCILVLAGRLDVVTRYRGGRTVESEAGPGRLLNTLSILGTPDTSAPELAYGEEIVTAEAAEPVFILTCAHAASASRHPLT